MITTEMKRPTAHAALEADSDLPEGWSLVTLGELSHQIQYGYTASAIENKKGPRLLRITDIQNGRVNWDSVPSCDIDQESIEKYRLAKGDIVFARTGATTGKSYLIGDCPEEAVFASYLIRLRSHPQINPRFLSAYFNTPAYWSFISDNVAGNAQPNCNASKLSSLPVPIAPSAEQDRIVTKLAEALKSIDTSRERLTLVPAILKRFRQSVLAAACSGRLTEDWRDRNPVKQDVSTTYDRINRVRQDWFQRQCDAARAERNPLPKDPARSKKSSKPIEIETVIPESWRFYRLEDLCYLVTDGTHKTPTYRQQGIIFLSVKNVRPFRINQTDVKFIDQGEHRIINSRCNPERGDLLYTKVGATFGYAALNTLDFPFSIFVSLALIKPVHPYFLSRYAEVVMNSEIVFSQARERVSGIGTPDLHLIEIRDFRIPFPPTEEQAEIVRRVEALFKLADIIEKRVGAAQARADKLTQSILAKAFRGELVPTEAELARQEGREYEPASVLLERIRAQRAALHDEKAGPARSRRRVGLPKLS